MGELVFARPISASIRISSAYDKWRDVKDKNGTTTGKRQHKGIDYATPKGTSVQASESGRVVRASFHPPRNPGEISYGNVIIICHNPGGPDPGKKKDRHIYTLYAHLDEMYIKVGDYVEKHETIGLSGDTGRVGPHLHFEVIDAGGELGWNPTGNTGVPRGGSIRKDPKSYLNHPKKVEGTLPDIVERSVMDRIEFVPDIDLKRDDPFRLEAWLDGKNIGYVNKRKGTLKAKLSYDFKAELSNIWRKPLQAPAKKTIELNYVIKAG
ncbi:MAG: M23 family metallopeptidase [Thermodesulfobacteriota bacterium]